MSKCVCRSKDCIDNMPENTRPRFCIGQEVWHGDPQGGPPVSIKVGAIRWTHKGFMYLTGWLPGMDFWYLEQELSSTPAGVAELADAQDLKSCGSLHEGSTPSSSTNE